MRRWIPLWSLTCSLILLSSTVRADPILLGSVTTSIAVGVGLPDEVRFAWVIYDNPYSSPRTAELFDLAFTEAPTGSTFVATADNEPQFDYFTELLTNGESNGLDFNVRDSLGGAIAGVGGSETGLFGLPFGTDFSPFVISRLQLHINESSVSPDLTNFFVDNTLSVFGEPAPVPEPGTLSLLGLALATFTARRCRLGLIRFRGRPDGNGGSARG